MSNLILPLVIFLTILVGYLHPITAITQDLGRHILTGNIILSTHHVPKTNLFSYTYPSFPFINHHYGSEIIFALVQKVIGFQGLLILMTLVAVSGFAVIYFAARKHTSIIALSLISLLSIGVLYERTDLRPELFSFLLTAVFSVVLFRFRRHTSHAVFLLIPLELAWTQMHIYFPIGIILILLFLIDAGISHRKKLRTPAVLYLLYTLIGSCFVTLLNPNGLTGALYPFHVFQNYGYSIEENQNIFFLQSLFHKTSIRFYEAYVILAFLSFFATAKKRRIIDWLLLIVFSVLGAQAERNMPLLIFSTFIPFSESLTDVLQEAKQSETIKALQQKLTIKNYVLLLLLVLFLWQGVTRMHTMPIGTTLPSGASPAVDFLQKENLPGAIFNNFDIGSYLEYRLYPDKKVFIDGRPEAYPADFIQKVYIPMQEDPKLFQIAENHYRFGTIFFSHTDQTPWAEGFLKTIVQDKSWIPVYLDDSVIILIKNITANGSLITRFGMNETTLRVTGHEEDTKQSISQLLHFFNITGNAPQLKNYLEKLLQLDPKNCPALNALTNIYATTNPALANIDGAKYQQYCQ